MRKEIKVGDICRVVVDCVYTGAVCEIVSVAAKRDAKGDLEYQARVLLGPFEGLLLRFGYEDSVQILTQETHNDTQHT